MKSTFKRIAQTIIPYRIIKIYTTPRRCKRIIKNLKLRNPASSYYVIDHSEKNKNNNPYTVNDDTIAKRQIFAFLQRKFAYKKINLHFCKEKKETMIVSNKTLLNNFVQKHAKATKPLNRWLKKVTEATWRSHNDLKKEFPTADYVKNGRYVFNINGNDYRLVAVVVFVGGVLDVRFIGTHADYDKIKDCSEL